MQYGTVLELYPNREVRLGYQANRVRQRKGTDSIAQLQQEKYAEACHRLELIDKWVVNGGYADVLPSGSVRFVRYSQEQHSRDRKALLDIIKIFQDGTLKRKARKCELRTVNRERKFGTAQRRAILQTGAAMSKLYPEKGQTYEVTLTIPGGTPAALKCVAAYSSEIMNRLLQVVRDLQKRYSTVVSWFYVWEWQWRGALHLHMAVGCKNKRIAKLAAQDIEYRWFELLLELKDVTGIDCFARAEGGTWRDSPEVWQSHVAEIEKNLAAYFAKYASKDKDTAEAKQAGVRLYYPKTWWGRSRDLAEAVREQTIKISLNYQSEDECVAWYTRISEVLNNYKHIKEYGYDFQVERKVKVYDRSPFNFLPWVLKLLMSGENSLSQVNLIMESVSRYQRATLVTAAVSTKPRKLESRLFAYGERYIRYYEDDVFEAVRQEVETLAVWMKSEAVEDGWVGRLPKEVAQISRPDSVRNPERLVA